MRTNFLRLVTAAIVMTVLFSTPIAAQNKLGTQKEIAITIDDLPLNGPNIGIDRLKKMTADILFALKKHKVPAMGFVNEKLLYVPGETDARILLLRDWLDGGVELGNHTFSHMKFRDVSLADYEDDFIRGESVIRKLMIEKGQKVRYFRHPYLSMGSTRELEMSFEKFIGERGYKIAPVTIDVLDWMFLSAYLHARTKNDPAMLKQVSDEYLRFAGPKIDFCEHVSNELFGRQVKQILLLHANELNADNWDRLMTMFEEKGYRFISLEEALKDPFYATPDRYSETSDWLSGWAASKGKKFTAPQPSEFIQKEFALDQK